MRNKASRSMKPSGKSRYAEKKALRARVAKAWGYPAGTPFPVMGIQDSSKRRKILV